MGRLAGILTWVFLIILCFRADAQRYWELGGMGGISYYQGDVNPSRLFYSPMPTGGGFLRYTVNQRWQTRMAVVGGYLTGNDRDFSNKYQFIRNHSFSTPLVELSGTVEFNFKPFKLEDRKKFYSPYIYVGGAFFLATNASQQYGPAIPFGMGIKLNFLKMFTFGMEWGYRKTFTDGLDKLTWYKDIPVSELTEEYRLPKQIGYARQRDWYSFVLVSLSFKLYSYDKVCHLYDF
jgi:hypothetical protein